MRAIVRDTADKVVYEVHLPNHTIQGCLPLLLAEVMREKPLYAWIPDIPPPNARIEFTGYLYHDGKIMAGPVIAYKR